MPSNWIVWQIPIRDLQGGWFTGFSRWVSKAVRTPQHNESWTTWETVVEFMRSDKCDACAAAAPVLAAWGQPIQQNDVLTDHDTWQKLTPKIPAVPTIVVFRGGVEIDRRTWPFSVSELQALIPSK